jgi:hypothetical protein
MIRSIKSGKRSTRRNFVLAAAKLAEFDAFGDEGIDISSTVKVSQAHLCRRNRQDVSNEKQHMMLRIDIVHYLV